MGSKVTKEGRLRRYAIDATAAAADPERAGYLYYLDELRERAADQIQDLPAEALNRVFDGTTISVGRLALHMAWAELSWMERVAAGRITLQVAPELREEIFLGSLDRFDQAPPRIERAARIVELYRITWSEVTMPVCAAAKDLGDAVDHPSLTSVRKVLHHLLWHWTYHSGQIGILTLQLGYDYTWRFADARG
jgi:uncharacterized damage-inducible protein DinB